MLPCCKVPAQVEVVMHRRCLVMPSNIVSVVVEICFRRKDGPLRPAKPKSSGVRPMAVLGTCALFLTFPPADAVFARGCESFRASRRDGF